MELEKDFKRKESTAIACKGSGADGEIPTLLTSSRVLNDALRFEHKRKSRFK